jgi:hypothetical protein
MINSFHHLSPEHARGVLSAAAAARQPLLVYELADNRLPFALWLLMLPVGLLMVGLSCLLLTLKVRPRRPRQLLLTYVVPILPLLYAWDGQASYPRIYGFGDLDTLLQGLEHPGYTWTRGHAETASGRRMGIYLLGMPAAQPGVD